MNECLSSKATTIGECLLYVQEQMYGRCSDTYPSIANDGEPSRTVQHNIAKVRTQFPQFEMSMADRSRIPAKSQTAQSSDQAAASRGWRGAERRSAVIASVGQ